MPQLVAIKLARINSNQMAVSLPKTKIKVNPMDNDQFDPL